MNTQPELRSIPSDNLDITSQHIMAGQTMREYGRRTVGLLAAGALLVTLAACRGNRIPESDQTEYHLPAGLNMYEYERNRNVATDRPKKCGEVETATDIAATRTFTDDRGWRWLRFAPPRVDTTGGCPTMLGDLWAPASQVKPAK